MAKTCVVVAALLAVLCAVVTSAISPPRDDVRLAEFYDWLVQNYRNMLDHHEPHLANKRSDLWQFKNRRCNPLYDWNCNNPWGRIGRRR